MSETSSISLQNILDGGKRAIAASLNLLENRRPEDSIQAAELIEKLCAHSRPHRHVIGVTGPPGAGKSTLLSRLIRQYRLQGLGVGVLTVDPTSLRSGGALLGDRARIAYDPSDRGVFIRSMAAGGHLGGLAWRTRHLLVLFEAVYDRILIETVGVGQSETEVERVADTVVYVVQPGSGDSLQFMKAGIMEIPHVLVINKADQKAPALKALHELESVAGLSRRPQQQWRARLILASALEGWGEQELMKAVEDHFVFLSRRNLDAERRERRIGWVYDMFRERFGSYGVERFGGKAALIRRIGSGHSVNPFRVLELLSQEYERGHSVDLVSGGLCRTNKVTPA